MEIFILILELIGSMAFSASGAMTGIRKNMDVFGVCILGLTTAVGGGVIRDMMAGDRPYIFIKHVYASASLAGAALCSLLWQPAGRLAAMMVGLAAVVTIRMLAAHFRWKLPKVPL